MRCWVFVFVLVGVMLAAMPGASYANGLFGMIELKSTRIESIPKWTDVLGRIRGENLYGRCVEGVDCAAKREEWYQMLQGLQGDGRRSQMVRVNRWANAYPYITDDELLGRSDYWQTPGQFVDRSGDCEDYAITKYYSLKRLGWPESDLRLLIVQDQVRGIPHAILGVTVGDEEFILDNLATEPLPERYVRQYTPYYAVNATNRWIFVKPMK